MKLLKWKDSQNLVFWMLDDYDCSDDDNGRNLYEFIAPFWHKLSSKLTNLYDPVTRKKYLPLKLTKKFWKEIYNQNEINSSKFGSKTEDIINEIALLITMQYKSIQEIIYQSNPNSLKPMISYNHNNINNKEESQETETQRVTFSETIINGNNWFLSSDYYDDDNNDDTDSDDISISDEHSK